MAQGRTIRETIEIAADIAKKLIEAPSRATVKSHSPARDTFDYPLIVAT